MIGPIHGGALTKYAPALFAIVFDAAKTPVAAAGYINSGVSLYISGTMSRIDDALFDTQQDLALAI